jgi:heat-inducible transcriptional repressor
MELGKLFGENGLATVTGTLSERERQVLEAVIETYVQTAEPAGSRTIAKRFGMALSAATIRNTMSDLEEKGYLYHPHTSAGRIPTDLAYRLYVDSLMRPPRVSHSDSHQIREELSGERAAVDLILSRAAQVLGVLTRELGVAAAPSLDAAVLERLELLQVSSERLLLVLTLKSGVVRSIFVEVPSRLASEAVAQVAVVLNDRLAGLTLREIRATLSDRLRDSVSGSDSSELMNIFIQEADDLFDVPAVGVGGDASGVLLGSARLLAEQPEFSTAESLQGLMQVTERRDVLHEALARRLGRGITVTIGAEHEDPKLASFTLVTSAYRVGPLNGVIGVMGPTRMPYDKIVALVDHTSRLVEELLS